MRHVINSFRGEVPRLTPRALPDNAAQDATNARLFSGDLTAWKQFALTTALANAMTVEKVYLLKDKWLSFTADADVARGIIPGDTTYRAYITAPTLYDEPQFTNYALATTGSAPYPVTTRPIGVPAPDSAPTLVVAPDTTSPDFISVADHGDQLAASWTVSGTIPGALEVTQDAVVGNPAPSYRIFENGGIAFLYRDFGTTDSATTTFQADFAFEVGDGNHQAGFAVGNDLSGSGARVQIGTNGSAAVLSIGPGTGWGAPWSAVSLANFAVPGPGTQWFTMKIGTTHQSDGTTQVTATVFDGVTQVATVSLQQAFTKGGAFGFASHTTNDAQATHYDNILVTGSGTLTPTTIVNIATSYVFTFVNDLGEESAPGPASATIARPSGVQVTVTTPTGVPTGIDDNYSIVTKHIYRAVTGTTGTEFLFVAEIPLSQADYVDVLPDSALGEVLPSSIWALPPFDLQGILALPNGVMVGFSKNQLCFSAQNHPHAWPVEYRLNTDTDIVGIANIDNTVVIGTQSFLYIATGNDPAAYSMAKLEVPQAAVSKRSFAYLAGIGVAFAGPDGLMACAGYGRLQNLTENIFTRRQWQALNPSSILGVAHNDIYWLFYDTGTIKGCYALDTDNTGFGLVSMAFHASAAYADPISDNLYLVLDADNEPADALLPIQPNLPSDLDGKHLYQFEGSNSVYMTYRWRSKLWLQEYPAVMQIAQVRAADYTNLVVRFYGDGSLIKERIVTADREFILPTAQEYNTFEIELVGTSVVRIAQAAEVVEELT